jgi:hypothetical protein
MPDDPLSEGDVDDVLAGRQPADRADYWVVAEWIAHLRETSRVQPAPPINPHLRAQIDGHPVPASPPLESRDDVSGEVGVTAVTAITARSPAVAPEATDRDPRLRRTAVSLAAAVMLLLGAVAGVRLAAGQPDEPDVRSRPATEPPIERSVPAGDPDDPDDADRSQEGGPKEPPPPAEPEPPEPPEDSVGGSQPEPTSRDPLVTGEWGDLAEEWLERYCESQMPPHRDGGPRRGGFGPHSSRDFGVIVCEPSSSGASPHDRNR